MERIKFQVSQKMLMDIYKSARDKDLPDHLRLSIYDTIGIDFKEKEEEDLQYIDLKKWENSQLKKLESITMINDKMVFIQQGMLSSEEDVLEKKYNSKYSTKEVEEAEYKFKWFTLTERIYLFQVQNQKNHNIIHTDHISANLYKNDVVAFKWLGKNSSDTLKFLYERLTDEEEYVLKITNENDFLKIFSGKKLNDDIKIFWALKTKKGFLKKSTILHFFDTLMDNGYINKLDNYDYFKFLSFIFGHDDLAKTKTWKVNNQQKSEGAKKKAINQNLTDIINSLPK